MLNRIICAGLLLLCTGCYNKARSHSQSQAASSHVLPKVPKVQLERPSCAYRTFVDEAQLADIPLPDIPGAVLSGYKETLTDPRRQIFNYTSSLSLEDCAAFYRVHMEYVGWQEKQLFAGHYEHCLLFKKPSRRAIITVSTGTLATTQVTIFTGPRKKSKGA